MSPGAMHDNNNSKVLNTIKNNKNAANVPPPLQINKDSQAIMKKSALSACSAGNPPKQPQRLPVIIYTQSPRIIHTNPNDFMALVQKLTGQPKKEENVTLLLKNEGPVSSPEEDSKGVNTGSRGSDDCESSSVLSDENNSNCPMKSEPLLDACFAPSMFEPPPAVNPYVNNMPVFNPNSTNFLIPDQVFNSYQDSMFLSSDVTSSITTLEDLHEFHDY